MLAFKALDEATSRDSVKVDENRTQGFECQFYGDYLANTW